MFSCVVLITGEYGLHTVSPKGKAMKTNGLSSNHAPCGKSSWMCYSHRRPAARASHPAVTVISPLWWLVWVLLPLRPPVGFALSHGSHQPHIVLGSLFLPTWGMRVYNFWLSIRRGIDDRWCTLKSSCLLLFSSKRSNKFRPPILIWVALQVSGLCSSQGWWEPQATRGIEDMAKRHTKRNDLLFTRCHLWVE